jgi:hypothetical protein
MKYSLDRIKIRLFTQQVGWLDDKRVEFHPWGLKIKCQKWHSLWSTLEYWLNILYVLRLFSLGGGICQ